MTGAHIYVSELWEVNGNGDWVSFTFYILPQEFTLGCMWIDNVLEFEVI